jgi:TPR repeat protein
MRKLAVVCAACVCWTALPAYADLASGVAAYEKKEYAVAYRELKPLADKGNAVAQQKVGSMYRDGNGVSQDDGEACKWYSRAATQGNVYALTNMGDCYSDGKAVPQDYKEAVRWYRLAAAKGDEYGLFNLGTMYDNGNGVTKDKAEAMKWFRLAADRGMDEAQLLIAVAYLNGEGVPQDDKAALKWMRLAADKGNSSAMKNLGVMYENGQGVAKDDAEALKWFRLAAEKGNARAQARVGIYYAMGDLVPKDFKEAARLFRLAADQGDDWGQLNLGKIYEKGAGVAQDYKEAAKWYRLAANQGSPEAMNNLGVMYANGVGVARNRTVAYALNLVSESTRDDKTPNGLAEVKKEMTKEQIEKATSLSVEMAQPGNLLKTLDQYFKRQADAMAVLVRKKTARYKISTDGREVTDTETELIWRRCAEGMTAVGNSCKGTPLSLDHQSALKRAADETKRTGKHWYLPNTNELMSIRDHELQPAFHPIAFPDTPNDTFWSSDPNKLIPTPPSSWVLGYHGETVGEDAAFSEDSYDHPVRLVRLPD